MIDGAQNSPLFLGILQLDRTPPTATAVVLTPEGGTVTANWTQSDPLSGTDPARPTVVEVNASPAGDAAGAWVPFAEQPAPGEGRQVARTDLGGLEDGRHLVRVRSADRAGNEGAAALGVVVSDRTPPRVIEARLGGPVRSPRALAEIVYRATDGDGVGVSDARPRVAPVGAGDEIDWASEGASGPGRVLVRLPGPGVHVVTLRIADRVGNRAVSGPVTIRVPTPAEAADFTLGVAPGVNPAAGLAPGAGISWAYARTKRVLRAHGMRVTARLHVARDAARWRRMVGRSLAPRYTAYSTLSGRILLGPGATKGLDSIVGARPGGGARGARTARGASRADLDEAVLGLAVLLHEALHESGPIARDDIVGTRSGRAFEEGFTEAATRDLLPELVAGLALPPDLRARLGAAVARYRLAYPAEVAWARRVSVVATRSPAGSARARAWRVGVAGSWGADRWQRLAAATGREEAALRLEASALGSGGPRR